MLTPDEIKKGLEACSRRSETVGACKQCPYVNVDNGCFEVTRDALACIESLESDVKFYKNLFDIQTKTIEFHEQYEKQLEQRLSSVGKTFPEWISVEDRLPKHGQIVFCYTKYFYEVLQWDDDSEQWCGQNSVNAKHYVTHWMPLLEPPKEETK